jgi:glyoxylase-like metal-dependent hydrolase (beta-lactamase superfamily II)
MGASKKKNVLAEMIPTFAKQSDRVFQILGLNPGKFTLEGTNTYLLGTGPTKILLDTGDGNEMYPDHFAECLRNSGTKSISKILITHRHYDHIGGIKQIQRIMNNDIPVFKKLTHQDTESDLKLFNYHPIVDGQVFTEQGITLKAIATPGHTDDHISFYLEEECAIFTGDLVLGAGTSKFEDLEALLGSLRRLLSFSGLKRLYPGHGPVVEHGIVKVF